MTYVNLKADRSWRTTTEDLVRRGFGLAKQYRSWSLEEKMSLVNGLKLFHVNPDMDGYHELNAMRFVRRRILVSPWRSDKEIRKAINKILNCSMGWTYKEIFISSKKRTDEFADEDCQESDSESED